MPNIRCTIIGLHLASLELKTPHDIYGHLKSLERTKGGSIALDVLYKLCTSYYGMNIDQWTISLLERYNINIIRQDGLWFLGKREMIKVCLFKKKDFVIVVRPWFQMSKSNN